MRPSRLLLKLLLCLTLLASILVVLRISGSVAESSLQSTSTLFWSFCALLSLVAGLDLLRRAAAHEISVSRVLPASVALGVRSEIQLTIKNSCSYPMQLSVLDQTPELIESIGLPVSLFLLAKSSKTVYYNIVPKRRGDAEFGVCQLRIDSRWGLWQTVLKVGASETVKVYPDFSAIARLADLGMEQSINQLGIHQQQRRGEGLDFQQLREFREGDVLRQIDWKATARHRKPISKDYQDERDQEIIFLLDCGRRMRSRDGALSHFDHALNALLLTTYIALRQGDGVGLATFAGDSRWLSPLKEQSSINTFLKQLYDLHSSTQSSDYLRAAQDLMGRHNKRALVIILTNVREEDSDDLLDAAKLLKKKHRVMIANLREVFLDDIVDKNVVNFSDAMTYCGSLQYIQQRQMLLKKLLLAGVMTVDSTPQQLYIKLLQEYLAMKRSGLT